VSETTKRLDNIESRIPRPVKLWLDDGSVFIYPKGPLKLFGELLNQVYEKEQRGMEGPLLEVFRRAVKSENYGRKMLEMSKTCLSPGDR
jgi:hypothetical protein